MPTLGGTSRPVEEEDQALREAASSVLGTAQEDKSRVRFLAKETSPEEATKQWRLSREFGARLPLARKGVLAELQAGQIANSIDFSDLDRNAPALAKHLRNPSIAPTIFDDVPVLSSIERLTRQAVVAIPQSVDDILVRPIKRAGQRFIQTEGDVEFYKGEQQLSYAAELRQRAEFVEKGFPQEPKLVGGRTPPMDARREFEKSLAENMPPEFRQNYANELKRIGREQEAEGLERIEAGALQSKLAKQAREVWLPSEFAGATEEFLGEATEAVFYSVIPLMGMSLVPVIGPPAALGFMGRGIFANEYAHSRQVRGRTKEEAAMDATFKSFSEAITETIPLAKALKLGKPGLRAMVKKAFGVSLAEAGQEMLVEALNTAYDAGVIGEETDLKTALNSIIRAGALGFVIGAPMGVIGSIKDNTRRNRDYQDGQRWLNAIVDKANQSKAFKRDPELFEELHEETLGNVNLYVDAEKTQTFFQEKEELLGDLMKIVPEVKEQLNDAVERGGDLILPAHKVVSALAQRPELKDFMQLIRPTQDSLTNEDHEAAVIQSLVQDVESEQSINEFIENPRIKNVTVQVERQIAETQEVVTEFVNAKDALEDVKTRMQFARDLIKCLNQ